ncbi:hypothetical protein HDU79_008779 [Rhizoclosmatium sp. JEL0117]|nr:hypothetical protein HDU79_008779 [Rhizoclosmatium sp. JEL0117]
MKTVDRAIATGSSGTTAAVQSAGDDSSSAAEDDHRLTTNSDSESAKESNADESEDVPASSSRQKGGKRKKGRSKPEKVLRQSKYTKRTAVNTAVHELSDTMKRKCKRGIRAAAKKYKLKKDVAKPILDVSNKHPEGSKQYRSQIKGLKYFFVLIGDYDSLLIMEPNTWKQVVPASFHPVLI